MAAGETLTSLCQAINVHAIFEAGYCHFVTLWLLGFYGDILDFVLCSFDEWLLADVCKLAKE